MGTKAKVSMIGSKSRSSGLGARPRPKRDGAEQGRSRQELREMRQERRSKELSWQEEFMKVMAADLREIRAAMKNFATKDDLEAVKADVTADVMMHRAEERVKQTAQSVGDGKAAATVGVEKAAETAVQAGEILADKAESATDLSAAGVEEAVAVATEAVASVDEATEEAVDVVESPKEDLAAEDVDVWDMAEAEITEEALESEEVATVGTGEGDAVDVPAGTIEEVVSAAETVSAETESEEAELDGADSLRDESWTEPVELTSEEIETLTAKNESVDERLPEDSDSDGVPEAVEHGEDYRLKSPNLTEVDPAQLAAFATKEDLLAVQNDVKSLLETIGGLDNGSMNFVTKDDLQEVKEDVRQLQDSVNGLKEEQKNFSTKDDISRLQEAVEHLHGDMNGFVTKDDIMSLQYSVGEFKTEMGNFVTKEDIQNLRESIENMKEDYKGLKSDSLVMKKSVDSVKDNFRYLNDSLKEQNKRLEHMIEERVEKLEGMYKQSQMMALVTIVIILAVFAGYMVFGK